MGGCPVHCRMLDRIPVFYPRTLVSSPQPQVRKLKTSPDITNGAQGAKLHPPTSPGLRTIEVNNSPTTSRGGYQLTISMRVRGISENPPPRSIWLPGRGKVESIVTRLPSLVTYSIIIMLEEFMTKTSLAHVLPLTTPSLCWAPFFPSDTPNVFPPQGICTCCSFLGVSSSCRCHRAASRGRSSITIAVTADCVSVGEILQSISHPLVWSRSFSCLFVSCTRL